MFASTSVDEQQEAMDKLQEGGAPEDVKMDSMDIETDRK